MNDRICNVCKIKKEIEQFSKNKSMSGGRRYECRDCAKKEKALSNMAKESWRNSLPDRLSMTDAAISYFIKNGNILLFNSKVNSNGDCHLWMASKDRSGYGQFSISIHHSGRVFSIPVKAHRLSYAMGRVMAPSRSGPKSNTATIDHICGNPACVNPEHLQEVSHSDNLRLRHARARNA